MIRGEINATREATVALTVNSANNGLPLTIDAVIDTGFSDYLSLQPQQIKALQLPLVSRRSFFLADNKEVDFVEYAAIIDWDGRDRGVTAIESDGPPTIGMGLLYGHSLTIDIVDGGKVEITQL